jgi:hypothetical protein
MNSPRKYFVASDLEHGTINERFGFLSDKFNRALDLEDADYIIYDVNHPARDFPAYLQRKDPFLIPKSNIPVIFIAFEPLDPHSQFQLETVRNVYDCDPPVCKTQQELTAALSWLGAMLPFHNDRGASAELKNHLHLLVGALK